MASVAAIVKRRRNRKARRQAVRAKNRLWFMLIAFVVTLLVIIPVGVIVGGAVVMYSRAVRNLPMPGASLALGPNIGPTRLYDASGEILLYSVQDPFSNSRTWVSVDDLPPYVTQATLLMEDPDFLNVTRFDPFQTLSKLWRNTIAGPLSPDATLTGRLVRNVIAPESETVGIDARANEIALVAEINRLYSPTQVLEWHLNTNYYGNEIYGIDAAAQFYLGRRAVDLTLDEAALLAAIPSAPEYNPLDDETAARGRQADTLRMLLAQGMIDQAAYTEAANTTTPIRLDNEQTPSIAPEFAVYARRQAEHILNDLGHDGTRLVSRGGLRIVTTLDVDLYLQSECTVRTHLAQLAGESPDGRTVTGELCTGAIFLPPGTTPSVFPPDEAQLVILDVGSGAIKSMIGSVTKADHQPGPMLFPFVYLTGFLSRAGDFNAGTMLLDIPYPFPGTAEGLIYTPVNADGQFHGPLNLRDAMGGGLLPPAAWVAHSKGINNVLSITHQLGVNGLDGGLHDLSLLERGGTVSLMDIVYAYNVFATLGQMPGVAVEPLRPGFRSRDPVAVLRIEDANGNVLWEYDLQQTGANCTPQNCSSILEPGLGYLVDDILADQETRWSVIGENNVLDLARKVAVVNGLTSDRRDDWTAGYTPQLMVGVHLNRSDEMGLDMDAYGLNGAAAIWRAVMEYTNNRDALLPADWERPETIVEAVICERSGLLPNGNCPVRTEIFRDGTQQLLTPDTYWQEVEINSQNGLLARANTPTGLRSKQRFFVPPAEAMDWWKANNLPLPPTEYDIVTLPDALGATQILQPLDLQTVGGMVDVRGSMDGTNMQYYQLSYGQGLNPESWIDITGQRTDYVPGTTLAMWDTTGLDGLYTLRLIVRLQDNTIDPAVVNVTVDNVAPIVVLTAGEPGKIYRWPDDSVIPLVAEAADNLKISRVEFYHNGQFIGTDDEWPYGFDWDINRTGIEMFSTVVFDSVGNSASADIQVEVVRSG